MEQYHLSIKKVTSKLLKRRNHIIIMQPMLALSSLNALNRCANDYIGNRCQEQISAGFDLARLAKTGKRHIWLKVDCLVSENKVM